MTDILPCGHKRSSHYPNRTNYCLSCQRIAKRTSSRRGRPPAKRHIYPQYYRWRAEIASEVRRVSR